MTVVKLLPSFFLVASVASVPLETQSQVSSKRAFPMFDDEGSFEKGQQDALKRAFPDAIDLVVRVTENYEGYKDIWSNYFPENDHDAVMDVFQRIVPDNENPGEGSKRLKDCRISGYDFLPAMKQGDPCAEGADAYTANWRNEDGSFAGYSLAHFCPPAYKYVLKYSDIRCNDLGDVLSDKMEFLGATVLHEWLHNDNIGKIVVGEHIEDVDGPNGYGPANVRRIASQTPEKAKINADSYTWLALEVFWTRLCLKKGRYKSPAIPAIGRAIENVVGVDAEIGVDD